MKFKLLKIRSFLKTTLIGGLSAILPLAILIFVIKWVFGTISKIISPIVGLFNAHSWVESITINILVIAAILIAFFLIGVLIQTRLGKFIDNELEDKLIMKIPGYKIIKDIVKQFFGKNKSFFNEVVLVQPFNDDIWQTGFVTDKPTEDIWTVFVPTGPNPTSGMVYHVKINRIQPLNVSVDEGMKSIISCGSGSKELFKMKKNEQ